MYTVLILLASAGFYLVLVGGAGTSELIATGPVAVLTTLVAVCLRRAGRRPLAASWAWAHIVGAGAADLPRDCWRVGVVLFRAVLRRPAGDVGGIASQPISAHGSPGRRAGLCAAEMLGRSLAPNGFALDADAGAMRLHVLARGEP